VLRLELADVYLRRGQPLVALDEVKQALALSPELPTAWSLRGLVYLQMRDEARALASFDRAHQLAPNDPDVLHNRGWLLCQQARPGPVMDQAQLLLQRASASQLLSAWA
jgi:type IV pilus assembly protein PilF